MNYPCVLSIFLADGIPDGLKIIQKSNWNGCGLICPRDVLFERHRKRLEFDKPGVYLLVGGSDDGGFGKKLYIGEGDPTMARLENHLRKKDWWTHAIVFTSTDQTLNKAFVQYFEVQLVTKARRVGRHELENCTVPISPSLSEQELSICEGFLREMLLCLPLLGVNLEPNIPLAPECDSTLFILAKGIEAKGIATPDGFVVLSGSGCSKDETNTIQRLRHALMEEGILRDDSRGVRQFAKDHLFGSPSTASAVILGASSNGREAWKNRSGETLKSIQLR